MCYLASWPQKMEDYWGMDLFSDDSRTTQFLAISWLGMFSRLLHGSENFPDPTAVKQLQLLGFFP